MGPRTTRAKSGNGASASASMPVHQPQFPLDRRNDETHDDKEKADDLSDNTPSAPPTLSESVRSVKLLVYNVNDYNETSIYIHKRNASRDGNVDINGVLANPFG